VTPLKETYRFRSLTVIGMTKIMCNIEARCILIDITSKHSFLSCRFEFECTNNTTEYKSLVKDLRKAIDLNIKELVVFGDSQIIVRQVKNNIHCNSPHLRNYQQEVHRLVDNFLAFNITMIPQSKNLLADSIATIASRLSPFEDYEASRFTIDLLYKLVRKTGSQSNKIKK
jgi:ribonuclease HI